MKNHLVYNAKYNKLPKGGIKMLENIKKQDIEVYKAIQNELKREQTKIELIASENFVSKAVMEANRMLYDK